MACCFPPHRESPAVMCLHRYTVETTDEGRAEVLGWLRAEIPAPWCDAIWVDADDEGAVLVGTHLGGGRQAWKIDGHTEAVCMRLRLPVRTPPPWLRPTWPGGPDARLIHK